MIVIDASIVIKWVKNDEQDCNLAKSIYLNHQKNKEKIIVPKLIFYEAANFLATKTQASESDVRYGIQLLFKAKLDISEVDQNELINASIAAKKYHTTVYDMIYAEIARKYNTVLITADEKFIQKTKFSFVKLLSEYLS